MTGLAHKPRSRAGVAANGAYRKRVFDALDAHLADRVSAQTRLEYESPAVFQSGDRADGSVASSATLRATAPGRTWHSHCIKGVAANLLCRSVEVTTGAINDFRITAPSAVGLVFGNIRAFTITQFDDLSNILQVAFRD